MATIYSVQSRYSRAIDYREKPRHGGDIQAFAEEYGFDAEDCLDLSTGVAPWAWPVPEIPQDIWQKLPSSTTFENDLLQSAAAYYGCDAHALLTVSGSQTAIECLPSIVQQSAQIAFPFPGYEEHRFAWANAGKIVHAYRDLRELQMLLERTDIDHAVVINPNNPSTETASSELLESIRRTLYKRGGFLIIDEAFTDARPEISQMHLAGKEGLILLRSIGKFFGLAGLRLGFVAAAPSTLKQLKPQLGLWRVHTPALWLGAKLLSDTEWIKAQRLRVNSCSRVLLSLLQRKCPDLDWKYSELFLSGFGNADQVSSFVGKLADTGIHSRQFCLGAGQALLRLGLTHEAGIAKIEDI